MILNNKQVLVYRMKNCPVSLVLPRNKWLGMSNTLTFIIECKMSVLLIFFLGDRASVKVPLLMRVIASERPRGYGFPSGSSPLPWNNHCCDNLVPKL
jgi:hypothetical protein